MVNLLDVNLLIALAWPTHIHHAPARSWFQQNQGSEWATCSFTEVAFVRLSSNSRIFPTAPTPSEVLVVLDMLRRLEGHRFLPDQATLVNSPFCKLLTTHKQVTDAHLLNLAASHDACLVTFDRRIARLLPPKIGSKNLEILDLNKGNWHA